MPKAGYHVLIQRERELSGPTDTRWVLVSADSEEQARNKVAQKYPDWTIKEVKAP